MHRKQKDTSSRAAQIRVVAHECLRRRSAGEDVSDAQVLSSRADLMPELGVELRKMALIRGALFAGSTAAEETVTLDAGELADEIPADALPGYSIIGEIHRGGQGVVYRAFQHSTSREVAIKVVRDGPLAGRGERVRFEREVEILATLKHPHIVSIHDSGAARGMRYYVMDFIEGRPLDEAVGAPNANIASVVKLFTTVADAVNAAHLRGVIHRDLKPANVLVDNDGQPHVLDFGLARVDATFGDNAERSVVTETGQFVGSAPWSSPEQASGRVSDTDVRTDVYALGVMIYQALTGRFPYKIDGSVHEVFHNIIEAEPAPPRAVRREIDGDLETIVLKCLSKQRERRYQSAGELARDLRRYRANEPIAARRDSTWYVLRKSVQRHKVAFAFAATVLVLLVGFTFALGVQNVHVRAASDAATDALDSAQEVTAFLQDTLAAGNPFTGGGDASITVLRTLDQAAGRIEDEFRDRPQVEAAVRYTIGRTYLSLAAYESAEKHLRRALELYRGELGPHHRLVADTRHALAELDQERGDFAAAEAECRAVLALREELLGREHEDVAESLTLLAHVLRAERRYDQAEYAIREAMTILQTRPGEETEPYAEALNVLAGVYQTRGDSEDAEPLYQRVLDIRRRVLGEDHPHVATTLNNLGTLYARQKQYDRAASALNEALPIASGALGDHPFVARMHFNLGHLYNTLGDDARSDEHFAEALRIQRAALDEHHPDLAATLQYYAELWIRLGTDDQAAPMLREAIEIRRAIPESSPRTLARLLSALGRLELRRNAAAAALPALNEAAGLYETLYGSTHNTSATARVALGVCFKKLGRFDDAQREFETAYAAFVRLVGSDHKASRTVAAQLVKVCEAAGTPDRAATWRTRAGVSDD